MAQNYLWLKVPIFRILQLTDSSDSFGLKIKVREEILAEPHALEFLKSVQREPSYGCLKFILGFAILRHEMREEIPPPFHSFPLRQGCMMWGIMTMSSMT